MSDKPHRYTPAQEAAIAARNKTLVAAAAGSGKTSVLTQLVINALINREIKPAELCAVTFTDKAANEMRNRIATGLINAQEFAIAEELQLASIGTIHSLCTRIIRIHGAAIGVDPRVDVYEESQTQALVRQSIERAITSLSRNEIVQKLLINVGDDRVTTLLFDLYKQYTAGDGDLAFVNADDLILPVERGELLANPNDAKLGHEAIQLLLQQLLKIVADEKRRAGCIEFDDLERLALEAIRIPDIRRDLKLRWSMVLVDEFQDTNRRQYEILNAIGDERLFMVGDEWQSIYRFRGAEVDVFRRRRNELVDSVIQMRENFRSSSGVIGFVNHLFSQDLLFGEKYEPVVAALGGSFEIATELLIVPTDNPPDLKSNEFSGDDSVSREANRVAERIATLIESKEALPSEIAILYAKGTNSDHFERALHRWGIATVRSSSKGLFQQPEIVDVLSVLKVLRNRRDKKAALSALSGPLCRMDWHELYAITSRAKDESLDLLSTAIELYPEQVERLDLLLKELDELVLSRDLISVVSHIAQHPGLLLGAAKSERSIQAVANLKKLVEVAVSAHANGILTVSAFLEHCERIDGSTGSAVIADSSLGAVQLMTIHSSKGLEFPYVFIVQAANTQPRSLTVPPCRIDSTGVTHIPVVGTAGKFVRTEIHNQLQQTEDEALMEESYRLWYVATTRAKRRLFISGGQQFIPKKDGGLRSKAGVIKWLASALSIPDEYFKVNQRHTIAEGNAYLDTHIATREPYALAQTRDFVLNEPTSYFSSKLEIPESIASENGAELHQQLLEALSSIDASDNSRTRGIDLHAQIEYALDAALTGVHIEPETKQVKAITEGPVFTRLVELNARTEIPYIAGSGDVKESSSVPGLTLASSLLETDVGRIDALAKTEQGDWWVVDWKSSLPSSIELAWDKHATQLRRYLSVVRSLGTGNVYITLASIEAPKQFYTWCFSSVNEEGVRTELP